MPSRKVFIGPEDGNSTPDLDSSEAGSLSLNIAAEAGLNVPAGGIHTSSAPRVVEQVFNAPGDARCRPSSSVSSLT